MRSDRFARHQRFEREKQPSSLAKEVDMEGCAEEWGSVGTCVGPVTGHLGFMARFTPLSKPALLACGDHLYVPQAMAVCVGMSTPVAIALVSRFTLIAAPVR